MNKSAITGIVVVVIVLAAGGAYLALHKPNNANQNSNMTNMKTSGTPTDGTGLSGTESTASEISIKDFAFSPSHTSVKVGTKITWTNNDSVAHTITASDGPEMFDSGTVATGKTFSFTFTKAGDYKYHCSIHPSMTGTVTVTE